MSKIVIISGSPSPVSRSAAIASYLVKVLEKGGQQVHHLSLRELLPEALIHAQFNHPEIEEAQQLVDKAESLIVISPVYKASYPGILKSFFDLIPEKGLTNKKILPIVSGGTAAHLLSLEYAFKPLFSILGAKEILQGVYILDSQLTYSENEVTFLDSEIEGRLLERVNELLTILQDNLA